MITSFEAAEAVMLFIPVQCLKLLQQQQKRVVPLQLSAYYIALYNNLDAE